MSIVLSIIIIQITHLLPIVLVYKDIPGVTKFGAHGYDNNAPSMQAVFMANGPRFKEGVTLPTMQIIDLYHLFATLLNIHDLVEDLDIDGVNQQAIWNQILREYDDL